MAWAGWRLAVACRDGLCSVSASDPLGWITALAATAAARPQIGPRICIEVHGDFLNTARAEGGKIRRALLRRLLVTAARRADVVRVVHDAQAAELRALIPTATVEVVPPRVHPEIEAVLADASVARRPWPPTEVLGIGSHLAVKGWDLLLQAMAEARFGHLRLSLAGDGPLRADLELQAARLGVTERVRFLGFQPPTAVAQQLLAAHLVVVPSRHEGLPRTALEALCAGVPVLATPVGGIPALAARFEGLALTQHVSADSFGMGLAQLLAGPDAAAAAWLSRQRALEEFGYEPGLDRLHGLLVGAGAE